MARQVSLESPWESPDAEELDGQTAGTWIRRHVRTAGGRDLLQLGIEAVWAAQPEDISLLHLLFYIRSAGSLELLFDTEGGAQQDRFVGGSQRVAERVAEELGAAAAAARGASATHLTRRHGRARWRRAAHSVRPAGRWWRWPRRWPAGSSTTRRCRGCATS